MNQNEGELEYGSILPNGDDWRLRRFDGGMGETEYRIFKNEKFFARFDNRKDADTVMVAMTYNPQSGQCPHWLIGRVAGVDGDTNEYFCNANPQAERGKCDFAYESPNGWIRCLNHGMKHTSCIKNKKYGFCNFDLAELQQGKQEE